MYWRCDGLEKHEKKKIILFKLSLYLISLWILFFMLIILKIDTSDIPFNITCNNLFYFLKHNMFSIFCLFLMGMGGFGYLFFKDSLNNAKELPVQIEQCESVNYENLSFLATYVIPLVCFPMESDREIFVLFSVIIIIGCIFAKTNLYYSNPSLVLLGFNVYQVKTNSKKQFQNGIVIVRGNIKRGDSIKYLNLSDNVYFGRKIRDDHKGTEK